MYYLPQILAYLFFAGIIVFCLRPPFNSLKDDYSYSVNGQVTSGTVTKKYVIHGRGGSSHLVYSYALSGNAIANYATDEDYIPLSYFDKVGLNQLISIEYIVDQPNKSRILDVGHGRKILGFATLGTFITLFFSAAPGIILFYSLYAWWRRQNAS